MKVTVTILDERLNVKVSTSKIEVPVYHKVTNGGTEQIQSDFEQTDETAVDFIKNKPTIPSNAAQITVSDPVTPDFTPAVQGNNLQQVTNKVAGLQDYLYYDELASKVNSITISVDKNLNPLSIPLYSRIKLYIVVPNFVDEDNISINSRVYMRINNISDIGSYASILFNLRYIQITGDSYPDSTIEIELINLGKAYVFSRNGSSILSNNQLYTHHTNFNVTSINSITIFTPNGYFGIGSKFYLKKI